jgi:hypothetical protein
VVPWNQPYDHSVTDPNGTRWFYATPKADPLPPILAELTKLIREAPPAVAVEFAVWAVERASTSAGVSEALEVALSDALVEETLRQHRRSIEDHADGAYGPRYYAAMGALDAIEALEDGRLEDAVALSAASLLTGYGGFRWPLLECKEPEAQRDKLASMLVGEPCPRLYGIREL